MDVSELIPAFKVIAGDLFLLMLIIISVDIPANRPPIFYASLRLAA